MPVPYFAKSLDSPAVRSGIKFALSGSLAFFLARWMGLAEPEWAVTTAFVLSTAKFVGAIGEKTVLRIAGAMAGALIGILLVAWVLPHTWLFLLAMGLLTSLTTTMYGGSLAPYGFRQCGYTATLVAAEGLLHPAMAWQVGLARCEEICLGIAVTMILSTVLWPCYARVEFVKDVRETLAVLARIFRKQMETEACRTESDGVLEKVGGSFAKLRMMIRLGEMEGRRFLRRKPQVDEVVAQLGALSTALSNFERTLSADSVYREYLAPQLDPLLEALAVTMERLASPQASRTERRASLAIATAHLEAYQARLSDFRATRLGDHASIDESLDHAGHALAIHEIHDALEHLCRLLPRIEKSEAPGLPGFRLQRFRPPDADAVKAGVRGGITVVLGLMLLDWLRLPGGSVMLVGMYLLTVIAINSPDRRGDLGSFRMLGHALLACAVYWLCLVILSPYLSIGAVLFPALAVVLFIAGYALETGRMNPYGSMVCLLMVAVLVNLSSREPITRQDVAGPMTGLILAAVISTTIRRFLWPALPQKTYRACLGKLLALLERLASAPDQRAPMSSRAEIALYSAECMTLIGVMEQLRVMSPALARLHRLRLRFLARLGGHLISTTGKVSLPREAHDFYREGRARLLAAVGDSLRLQHRAVEGREGFAAPPALPPLREWTAQCRQLIRTHTSEDLPTYLSLGLLYRIEQIAVSAGEAADLAARITLSERAGGSQGMGRKKEGD